MDRKILKEAVKDARKRFKEYTTFENMVFICELLDLECDKFKEDKQDEISYDLAKIGYELSKLLSEVF